MKLFEKRFRNLLKENGPGYIPSSPNTSGSGGALGNAASLGANGSCSGTPGTDTYATGDARVPTFLGTQTRQKRLKRKKKK